MPDIAILPTPVMTQELAKTQTTVTLSPEKMMNARAKNKFVSECGSYMTEMGWSLNKAAAHLAVLIATPSHPLHSSALDFGKGKKTVGKAQIVRWFNQHKKDGIKGLVDSRQGKKRLDKGWEHRAISLYATPQNRSFELVKNMLVKEGFDVNYHEVSRYLKSLPTDVTTHSHGRLGYKFNQLNNRSYIELDDKDLAVGASYQGDGHECDVWVAHPATGDIWRPELTAWIDVKSRYITGWWLGESEKSNDTLYSLSCAIKDHNHIPTFLHVDNGPGYKSKILTDETTGFYDRIGTTDMFAIPGNSKGKGRIERWFRTFEEGFGKQWETYCGKNVPDEHLKKIYKGVKNGS